MTITIRLSTTENMTLKSLYKRATEMPVIGMSTHELLTKGSWADQAWEDVKRYMDALGKKYGYDPAKHAVTKEGEVIPHE